MIAVKAKMLFDYQKTQLFKKEILAIMFLVIKLSVRKTRKTKKFRFWKKFEAFIISLKLS
jgi:hypothetical protein